MICVICSFYHLEAMYRYTNMARATRNVIFRWLFSGLKDNKIVSVVNIFDPWLIKFLLSLCSSAGLVLAAAPDANKDSASSTFPVFKNFLFQNSAFFFHLDIIEENLRHFLSCKLIWKINSQRPTRRLLETQLFI